MKNSLLHAQKAVKAHKTIMSTSEASRYCNVSFQTIKNWLRTGKIKGLKLPSGHWRIKKSDLDEIISKSLPPNPEEVSDLKELITTITDLTASVKALTASMDIMSKRLDNI